MEAGVHFGKAGLTEGMLKQAESEIARCELIKVRFPQAAPADRKQAAHDLAEALSAEEVSMVGRTALLYRANDRLSADKRIHLR